MEYREISEDYSVSGQIQPEDVAASHESNFLGLVPVIGHCREDGSEH